MKAERTLVVPGAAPIWAAVAVALSPAGGDKEGFYLALYPDGRPSAVVFLRPDQARKLLEMAREANVSDIEIWDFVAKIPMEPILPSRSLSPRLRALFVDCADAIRDELLRQASRPRKLEPVVEEVASLEPAERASERFEHAQAPVATEVRPDPLSAPEKDPFSLK